MSPLQLDGAAPTVENEEPIQELDESHRQDVTHGPGKSVRQSDTRGQGMAVRQGVTCDQDESGRQDQSRPVDKSHRRAKSDRQEESDIGKSKTNTWDERTVEVTGLKPDTTGDAIVLLFESKLADDEDALLRIQRDPNRDTIYITFKTADG